MFKNNFVNTFKKTNNLLFIFIIFMLVFVIFIMLNKKRGVDDNIMPATSTITPTEKDNLSKTYVNKDLGFSLKYPSLLYLNSVENKNDYFVFIRFEESGFSSSKGFAIGVSKLSEDRELLKITEAVSRQNGVKTNSFEYELDKEMVTIDTYVSEEDKNSNMSFAVFTKNDLTFSVSASDDTVKDVLAGFVFFGNVAGCADIDLNINSNTYSYCGGELCGSSTEKGLCEEKDVVAIENHELVGGKKDNIPDCKWIRREDGFYCGPLF